MNASNHVPFLDLVTPHAELKEELLHCLEQVLETAGFIGGPMVQGFESEFASFCETEYCVGVSSGTDAVRFCLMAAGIEPGDAVITVPNTFIATTEAISQAGARPVFVDIDERTYNMDPGKLKEYIESKCDFDRETGRLVERRTKCRVAAIVPVHLYGQIADMDPILEVAERYGLVVIEDACQAHGSEYFSKAQNRWRRAGSIGTAAAFSFYPGKNLGACGEAGAVTTNDAELARKIRMLRDHGQSRKYIHEVEGYNGRLDALQAGFLRVKLRHLAEWNGQRCERAVTYRELFQSVGASEVVLPHVPDWAKPVFHLFVVRVAERELLMKHLDSVGIGTGIHYPIPLHLSAAYRSLGYRPGDLPVAEKAAAEVLSLPMFPGLAADSQRRVVSEVHHFLTTNVASAVR
jgi:dTDP-4-amino-4,6-dideoxygalactose transaminase